MATKNEDTFRTVSEWIAALNGTLCENINVSKLSGVKARYHHNLIPRSLEYEAEGEICSSNKIHFFWLAVYLSSVQSLLWASLNVYNHYMNYSGCRKFKRSIISETCIIFVKTQQIPIRDSQFFFPDYGKNVTAMLEKWFHKSKC